MAVSAHRPRGRSIARGSVVHTTATPARRRILFHPSRWLRRIVALCLSGDDPRPWDAQRRKIPFSHRTIRVFVITNAGDMIKDEN